MNQQRAEEIKEDIKSKCRIAMEKAEASSDQKAIAFLLKITAELESGEFFEEDRANEEDHANIYSTLLYLGYKLKQINELFGYFWGPKYVMGKLIYKREDGTIYKTDAPIQLKHGKPWHNDYYYSRKYHVFFRVNSIGGVRSLSCGEWVMAAVLEKRYYECEADEEDFVYVEIPENAEFIDYPGRD